MISYNDLEEQEGSLKKFTSWTERCILCCFSKFCMKWTDIVWKKKVPGKTFDIKHGENEMYFIKHYEFYFCASQPKKYNEKWRKSLLWKKSQATRLIIVKKKRLVRQPTIEDENRRVHQIELETRIAL